MKGGVANTRQPSACGAWIFLPRLDSIEAGTKRASSTDPNSPQEENRRSEMLSTRSSFHGDRAFTFRHRRLSASPALLLRPTIRFSHSPPFQSVSSSSSSNIFPRHRFQQEAPISNFSPRYPIRCGVSPDTSGAGGRRSFREWVELISDVTSTAFPLWVALGCLMGLVNPSSFSWVKPNWIVLGITVTMLGMGMTLSLDDLRSALSMPKELLAGFFLQYSVMPLSGYLVSKLLNLPPYYAAGLILVACCPGGTASNIVTYIARGNVALSVLMTAASTISAVVMTPFLTAKLAGQYVAVDAAGLLLSTLQVVLLPVLAGAFLNQYFQGIVRLVSPVMPPIAVVTVAVLCGNAIAQSSSAILMSGRQVLLAAALLHACGFFFGYLLSRLLGLDIASARTISIEVGMQNSVLGVVLATQHFGNPLTAVPCAVSSVCHSIFGSVLAGIWRRSLPAPKKDSAVDL